MYSSNVQIKYFVPVPSGVLIIAFGMLALHLGVDDLQVYVVEYSQYLFFFRSPANELSLSNVIFCCLARRRIAFVQAALLRLVSLHFFEERHASKNSPVVNLLVVRMCNGA
jgi:hypothetical protein